MDGKRVLFRCPTCGKGFTYWVQDSTAHPKVKCYFCSAEFHPRGEAPAAEVVPAAPPVAPAASAPAPTA